VFFESLFAGDSLASLLQRYRFFFMCLSFVGFTRPRRQEYPAHPAFFSPLVHSDGIPPFAFSLTTGARQFVFCSQSGLHHTRANLFFCCDGFSCSRSQKRIISRLFSSRCAVVVLDVVGRCYPRLFGNTVLPPHAPRGRTTPLPPTTPSSFPPHAASPFPVDPEFSVFRLFHSSATPLRVLNRASFAFCSVNGPCAFLSLFPHHFFFAFLQHECPLVLSL